MNNEIIIRPAVFGDIQLIFNMIREHPDELVPRPMSDIAQNIDRFLVAEQERVIVGMVSWGILPELGSAQHPSIEVKSLAVDARVRGQGIGKALMNAVLARIAQWEPEQVIALTFKPDFFQGFGFEKVAKEKLMHKLYTGCMNCTRYDNPFTCPEIAMSLRYESPEKESSN